MSATKRKYQDTFTLDEIAELVGVETWDKIEDRNPDAWGDYWLHARKEALADGLSDDEADEKGREAEDEARSESFRKWENALLRAAKEIIGEHGLDIKPLKTKSYLYKLSPAESWEAAAAKIIDTINGVGYFEFRNVKEFRDSLPATTRGAVLEHLHWMKRRPEVYGTSSAERLMGDWDR